MRTSVVAVVAQPVDAVWASLTDVDQVLASLPGATWAQQANAVEGSLKCRLGPAQITYRINVRAEVGQPEFHSAVLTVSGKEARGSGTIGATLTVALRSEAAGTRVEIGGDIEATGRGETADEKAWARVIETLVDAVFPRPQPVRHSAPAEPPSVAARPPLAVAPPLREGSPALTGRLQQQRQLGFGLAAVALLLLLRRLRRSRRG